MIQLHINILFCLYVLLILGKYHSCKRVSKTATKMCRDTINVKLAYHTVKVFLLLEVIRWRIVVLTHLSWTLVDYYYHYELSHRLYTSPCLIGYTHLLTFASNNSVKLLVSFGINNKYRI